MQSMLVPDREAVGTTADSPDAARPRNIRCHKRPESHLKIESQDKSIERLLNGGFYVIPRFQRPYSWERSHVEDFWNDLLETPDTNYFIGSFVLYLDGSGKLGIVDGQQRLTTITILLCALRNAFHNAGLTDLAHGLQSLVERKDIDNNHQFVLQTQSSYPFLQESIQSFDIKEDDDESGPVAEGHEKLLLVGAFNFLTAQVTSIANKIGCFCTKGRKVS